MNRASVRVFLSTFILLVLLGSGWVAAQNQPSQPSQPGPRMMCKDRFNTMDANHDGVITREEFMAVKHPGGHGEEVFKSRDANGDGVLSQNEFCAGKGKGQGGMGQGRMQ